MKNMTEGNVTKNVLLFAMPILLGNIFQQLYNTADTVIVGRFSGKMALAAVGAAGPVMNILLFFIVGLSLGAAILMSEFFGAEDIEKLKKELATAIAAGSILVFFLSVGAWIFVHSVLQLTKTPVEIIGDSEIYLKIIATGLIFSFLYNILSAAMRAVGDSQSPLVILIISACINVVLDIYLVKEHSMGVQGVAYATVISQVVSVVLCIGNIYFKIPELRIGLKDIGIDFQLLKKTTGYSLSYAIQQTVIFLGIIFVQGAVNPLGIDSIAAFNAGSKIDGFILSPSDSTGAALTTFISQNRGAGKYDRIIKGFISAIITSLIYCTFTAVVIFIFAKVFIGLFVELKETETILLGVKYLRTMAVFYILTAFCNTLQGFFRGMGRMDVTLIATIIQIPIRVILSYLLNPYMGISGVAVAMGIGWIFMMGYEGYKYLKYKKAIVGGEYGASI